MQSYSSIYNLNVKQIFLFRKEKRFELIVFVSFLSLLALSPLLYFLFYTNEYHEEYFAEDFCYVIDDKTLINNALTKALTTLKISQSADNKIVTSKLESKNFTPYIYTKQKDLKRILTSLSKKRASENVASYFPDFLPVDKKYSKIASPFGNRKHPILRGSRIHEGVDFDSPHGVNVYASGTGVVTEAGTMSGYGKVIIIKHTASFETRYAHLSKILIKKGQLVNKGDFIGNVGNTGLSTTSHLHFEIRKNGIATNPNLFLNSKNSTLK